MEEVTLPVVFRSVARTEFDDAGNWYEARRSGLGNAFTSAVRTVLERIARQPEAFAVAWKDIREALVSGFPYCVYFRKEAIKLWCWRYSTQAATR